MRREWTVGLIFLALALNGCIAFGIPVDKNRTRVTGKIHFSAPDFFANKHYVPKIEFGESKNEERFKLQDFHFSSWQKTGKGNNDTIEGVIYTPRNLKSSDIFLVLPGMKEDYSTKMLAEKLAYYGYHTIRISSGFLPLDKSDFSQAIKKNSAEEIIRDIADIYKFNMQQRIGDLMGLNDYIENSYGKKRIHVIGISLGGIVASLLMAVDPRIESMMMILSSANVARIVLDSQAPKKIAPIRSYREELFTKSKLTKDEIYKMMEEKLVLANPITYADRLKDKKILMVSGAVDMFGLLDTAIPYSSTRETWEAFGKPEWIIMAPGHISSFLSFLPFWQELSHPHHIFHTLFLDGSYADHLLKRHFLPMALR